MSTLWKNLYPGMPPSLANAYIILLFDVTEKVPQKNMAPMTMTWSYNCQETVEHDANMMEVP